MPAAVNCVVDKEMKMSDPTRITQLRPPLVYNNSLAHLFRVKVFNDDCTEADLDGIGVTGYFLNANNQTLSPILGSTTGNAAELILPPACYAVPGRFTFTMNLTSTEGNNSYIRTVMWVEGIVKRAISDTTPIDPGTPVTNYETIMTNADAAAARANSAAESANTAAQAAQGAAQYAVRYDSSQSLTEGQKTTVRGNIGLTAADDGNGNITFN